MSLLQDLGAQLRAAADGLPTAQVAVALARLQSATELLNRVRQTSIDPIGVPQLAHATEHAEHATAALRLAQDAIDRYLAALGLAPATPPPTGPHPPAATAAPQAPRPAGPGDAAPGERLGSWWRTRVTALTGEPAPPEPADAGPDADTDTAALLRRVAAAVQAGDRARLGRDLHAVDAAVGLNLAALTPPVLHHLTADLLGHEPRSDDLARLRDVTASRVRALLPGTAPPLVDTLLARICRSPTPTDTPVHPADAAVTAGVLTGVLLARLGRDAASLAQDTPARAAMHDG